MRLFCISKYQVFFTYPVYVWGLNNGHKCDMGFNIASAAYNSHEGPNIY